MGGQSWPTWITHISPLTIVLSASSPLTLTPTSSPVLFLSAELFLSPDLCPVGPSGPSWRLCSPGLAPSTAPALLPRQVLAKVRPIPLSLPLLPSLLMTSLSQGTFVSPAPIPGSLAVEACYAGPEYRSDRCLPLLWGSDSGLSGHLLDPPDDGIYPGAPPVDGCYPPRPSDPDAHLETESTSLRHCFRSSVKHK